MAPSWQNGVTDMLGKLEKKIDAMDGKLGALIQDDIGSLRERLAKVETRVAIYAGIAGGIGMLAGGLVGKLIAK